MNNSRRYWRKRFLDIAINNQQTTDEAIREASQLSHRARRNIQREIDRFVRRYAINENITEREATELLSRAEQQNWRMTLREFRRKAIEGGYDQQLNQEYYTSRVSRLQRLQMQIDMELKALAHSSEQHIRVHLTDLTHDTFWQSSQALGANFARFNPDMINELVNQPFHGKNFSQRIWRNTDKLARELKGILHSGVISGKSIQDMSRELAGRMDVNRNRAVTLIRTESAQLASNATALSYERRGVEKYEWLATLEARTCEVCQELHGQVFRVRDKQVSVNYPPYHPNCRCTTAPWFDESVQ